MRNTAAAEQRNQRLEDLMLFDPHVKYAKSIGVEDTKIRIVLLKQMKKNHCNFPNRQELLNAILDLKKDDECMKCKNSEKMQYACPVYTWCFVGHAFNTPPLVGCVPNVSLFIHNNFNHDDVVYSR